MPAPRRLPSRWPRWSGSTPKGSTALVERHNVRLKAFPPEIVVAARRQATDILAEVGQRNEMARKVHDSYAAFRSQIGNWSRISLQAVLAAREA